MQSIRIICLAVFCLPIIAQATPIIYTFEGSLTHISTTPGGDSSYITDQGISIGNDFTFIFSIDYEESGYVVQYDGDVSYGGFYADMVYTNLVVDNLGYNTDPNNIWERNYGIIAEYSDGYHSDFYTGWEGVYAHLFFKNSDISSPDFDFGNIGYVAFDVTDFDTSERAAGYVYGYIKDVVPVPEPSTMLLLGTGLVGLLGFGRKKFRKYLFKGR